MTGPFGTCALFPKYGVQRAANAVSAPALEWNSFLLHDPLG
jgi:hypothetical protein